MVHPTPPHPCVCLDNMQLCITKTPGDVRGAMHHNDGSIPVSKRPQLAAQSLPPAVAGGPMGASS